MGPAARSRRRGTRAPHRGGGQAVGRRCRLRSPSRRASSKRAGGKSATFGELAGAGAADRAAGPVQAEGSERLEADRHQQAAEGRHAAEVQRHGDLHHRRQAAEHADVPHRASAALSRQGRSRSIAAPALAVPGVKEVFAVLAGRRRAGRRLLGGEEGPRRAEDRRGTRAGTEARSTDQIVKEYVDLASKQGAIARNDGDTDAALSGAAKVHRGDLRVPVSGARADGAEQLRHPPHRRRRRRDEFRLARSRRSTRASPPAVLGLKPEQGEDQHAACRRQLRPPRDAGRRHGGGSRRGAQRRAAQGPDQGAVDARGRHQGRPLPADLRAQAARRRRRGRQHRRLGPGDRRPVVHEGLAVRSRHDEGRRRPDDGRGRQHAALPDPQPARVGAHDRRRRADAVVALGRLDAHRVLDRDVPRSARRRRGRRSARHPPQAAGEASAPPRPCWNSRPRRRAGSKPLAERPRARPCRA